MPQPTRTTTPRTPNTATTTGGADGVGSCGHCARRPASITTYVDGPICPDCASLYYQRCPGCRQWHRSGATCPICTTCDHCSATVPCLDVVHTVGWSSICGQCRRDFYWQCLDCDGWNPNGNDCGNGCSASDDDTCDEWDRDGCDCEECSGYRDELVPAIHCYDYKPAPVFRGTGPLFLGPEIELEAPYARIEECAAVAQSHLGSLGYLKADGSLVNGFEIVTHPMSYPWAMAHFPWPMLTELGRRGCTVTENTGLHVHVSRAGFASAGHTYRWMKFIHRNRHQVQTLARRGDTSWAAFTADDRQAVKYYAKGGYSCRHRAINTGNRDTFELRVFASSLDPGEVQAALGFAAGSIEYTRQLTVAAIAAAEGWTWSAFVTWLAGQPGYAPLLRQLEDLQCVC